MKLAGAAVNRFFAKPDMTRAGILIHGSDTMRVTMRRQDLIAALIGPEGASEMRLMRIAGASLRSDPAQVVDAMKARGFFPGPRATFVEDATDGTTPALAAALQDWCPGDATLVVTAGFLGKTSKLKMLFESHKNAYSVGIYDDPPSAEEIDESLATVGLRNITPEARADLLALGSTLDPGNFRQTLEKIALYKSGDTTAVSSADVAVMVPLTIETEMDDVLDVVAESRPSAVASLFPRLSGQGVQPVTLCIVAIRHFRALYSAASGAGFDSFRPPIPFRRRDRMLRQARNWGPARLEKALQMLVDTDLGLRSTSHAPGMAVMERTLMRLADLGPGNNDA